MSQAKNIELFLIYQETLIMVAGVSVGDGLWEMFAFGKCSDHHESLSSFMFT